MRHSTELEPMRLVFAGTFLSRLKGLLGQRTNEKAAVLLIPQCKSVHTFGMRYALDIAFANQEGLVVRSERNVRPGRLLACGNASFVLERAHDANGLWFATGDRIVIGTPYAAVEDTADVHDL